MVFVIQLTSTLTLSFRNLAVLLFYRRQTGWYPRVGNKELTLMIAYSWANCFLTWTGALPVWSSYGQCPFSSPICYNACPFQPIDLIMRTSGIIAGIQPRWYLVKHDQMCSLMVIPTLAPRFIIIDHEHILDSFASNFFRMYRSFGLIYPNVRRSGLSRCPENKRWQSTACSCSALCGLISCIYLVWMDRS